MPRDLAAERIGEGNGLKEIDGQAMRKGAEAITVADEALADQRSEGGAASIR